MSPFSSTIESLTHRQWFLGPSRLHGETLRRFLLHVFVYQPIVDPSPERRALIEKTSIVTERNEIDPTALQIEAPFALRRRGIEGKIVVGNREPEPDQTLLRALAGSHAWTKDLRSGKLLTEIATATGHSESYVRTRAQLAFLSPEIQKEILAGRQPLDLTLERIVRKPIPLEWDAQVKLYGFGTGSAHP